MGNRTASSPQKGKHGLSLLRRWRSDSRGATAIEFAFVATPFLMFAMGIVGIGLHFFTQDSVEHAVEAASRKIRTGQAQKEGKTLADFRQMVCDETAGYVDCSKLSVHVQTGNNWADIDPQNCLTNGLLSPSTGTGTDPLANYSGGASAVVLVTACYEWTLAGELPFLHLGTMSNGSALMQAVTTFRTEPYE
jgi:Flp pilus assembly protein TadG